MRLRSGWLSFGMIVLICGITLIPAQQLPRLEVDTSNQSMSATQAEDATAPFTNQTSLLIAVSADSPFTADQWQALNDLTISVKKVSGVTQAILPFIQADGWTMRLFNKFNPARAANLQNLLSLLRSKDNKTLGILVLLSKEAGTGSKRTQTLADLKAVLADHTIAQANTCLVGLPVVNETVGEMIQRDQGLLMPLSAGIIFLMLILIYRNPVGVIAPMIVIGLAVAWTLGIYAWRVQQLNVVTSLLAPVVMILSLATTVHVYEAFLGYRPQCQTTAQALAMSLRNIWRPCLFSALTTGAGLASLMCSSIPAVRLFGLYGALGVLLSFVFGISVTPLLLSWPIFDKWTTHAPHQSTWMGRLLATCTHLGWYRRKQILAAFSGISLLALIGLTQLHCNTNLLDFLNQDSELVHTSRLVDDRLIGVNTLTCRITSASGLVPPSQAYQAFLTEIENLDSINGVIPEAMTHDTDSQAQTWDVTLRVRAIGSKQALNLLTTLKTLAQHHFGPDATLRFGGYFYGIVTESDQLVTDLIRSFALALSIITILIGIQLRSFKATLMSLVPNVLSVLWIFGLMGLIGIDLSTGTAMIACVVLGLAVDHTIHYLSSLHHNQHPNLFQAIYRTTLGVGPALVISTLILAAGFGVGIAGSFKPTIYFSLFTALAMLAALFCNLLGMPVLMNLRQSKGQCLSAVNTESDSSPFEEVPLL